MADLLGGKGAALLPGVVRMGGGTRVSSLQAACILYVGVQLLLPGQDAGIDLGREYEMAKGMAGGGVASP